MATTDVASLPQLQSPSDSWHVYVHRIRAFVPLQELPAPEDTETPDPESLSLVRPYIVLVVSLGDGMFLSCTEADGSPASNLFVQLTPPTCDQVGDFLRRVMTSPRAMNTSAQTSGGSPPSPGRPKRVFVAHTASARTFAGEKTKWEAADDVCPYTLPLRRLLEPLDCSVHFSPVSSHVLENVVRGQIDPAFAPDGEEGSNLCHLPGLSDAVEAFTPQFGKSLFSAATRFLSSGAYHALRADAPVRVSYRIPLQLPDGVDVKQGTLSARVNSFLIRTGTPPSKGDEDTSNGHDSFGASIYASSAAAYAAIKAAAATTDGADALQAVPVLPTRGQAVVFVSTPTAPFADVDDAERWAWPLSDATGKPVSAEDVACASVTVQVATGDAVSSPHVAFPLFMSASTANGDADGTTTASGEVGVVELTRPNVLELQAFEVALSALAELAADPSGHALSAAAAAGESVSVRVESFGAKGIAEEMIVEVSVLPSALDAHHLGSGGGSGGSDTYL